MTLAILIATLLAGIVVSWALTIPLHRFKELRPMTPRDVAAEVSDGDQGDVVIRASVRSARCANCHHECTWRDVAPVISWFKGCPDCGTRMPATVPLLQIGVPGAAVLTVVMLSESWVALPFVFLVVVLAAISVVDLRIWLIPYWMPWAGAGAGLVLIAAVSIGIGEPGTILQAVIGAIVTYVVFFALFLAAPGKLGFSDVRLALLLGLFLAWFHPLLPAYGLLFGAVIAVVMGGVALALRGDSRFAFGPALSLGAMAAVWLHEPILRNFG